MRVREFFEEFSMDDISKELKILSLAFFLYTLAWSAINPFLSIYIQRITGLYSSTGLLIGLMFLLRSSIEIPLGDLDDKIGSKAINIFSLFNYLGVGFVYFFANSFIGILIARIWNTFSSSGVWISGATQAREFSKKNKEGESMAFFNFAWSLAGVLGPFIAIFIVIRFPLQTVFLTLPITSTVAAIIIWKFVPEAKKQGEKIEDGVKDVIFKDKVFVKEGKDFLSDKREVLVAFIHFIRKFNFGVLIMVIALFARELGGELWQIALIYSVFYIPFLSRIEFGALADDLGRKKILGTGVLFSTVVLFSIFLINSLSSMFVLTLLLAIGISMVAPSVEGIITKLGEGWEGEITGIYRSIGSLARGIGPIVAGLIADMYSLSHIFLLCGVLFIATFPVVWKIEL